MAVINAEYNGIVRFNPVAGQDGVLIASTGGAVSFPLKTDGKYMFTAAIYNTTAENDIHFNILAGQENMGAWQNGRGDIHLYAVESTRTILNSPYPTTAADANHAYHVVIGPFESARVVRAATSTANDIESVGDPCVRMDFVAVSSTEDESVFPSSTITAQTASAEIKLFKLPEVEYTT